MVGTFIPSVTQRDKIATKIGLEVASVGFSYSPSNRDFITNSIQGTSPIKLAYEGYYDLKPLKIWRTFMPTDGDANSLGATPYFGGRISSSVTGRDWIKFTANSFLEVINQKVPANVIENTNPIASYAGAHPPPGFSTIPTFKVVTGSDQQVLILDCINFPGHIFTFDVFKFGWCMFDFPSSGHPNESLGGFFSVVGQNEDYIDGLGYHHNKVSLFAPLPWPPTPDSPSGAGDTCFVSAPFPIDSSDGTLGVDNFPFPNVPSPESAT
jgi:hypothetical protein